ncbi:GTPase Era, mitochondrial-like [Rhopilema esculentum]|uniref:GTPase Era, mitochondrial-like n=1 Tax=Rhopilema esculentum TaxID=499914 RepID=UPI0031D2DAC7|eukprot:gene2485-18148_t
MASIFQRNVLFSSRGLLASSVTRNCFIVSKASKSIVLSPSNHNIEYSPRPPKIVCTISNNAFSPRNKGRPKQQDDFQKISKKILSVGMVGEPNAGKSTLINAFVGEKVSITSDVQNTTRESIYVPFVNGDTQLVFIDTPGIVPFQEARRLKLGRMQITAPRKVIEECDVLAVVVDLESKRKRERIHESILDLLFEHPEFPCVLILNKVDLIKRKSSLLRYAEILTNDRKRDVWGYEPVGGYSRFQNVFMVSGSTGDGVEDVTNYFLASAKPGNWAYEGETKVDLPIDKQIAELFRETLLDMFKHEIPWQVKQTTLLFEELKDFCRIHHKLVWPKKSQARFVRTKYDEISRITEMKLTDLLKRKIFLTIEISSSVSLARNLPF